MPNASNPASPRSRAGKAVGPSLPDFTGADSVMILETWFGLSPVAPLKSFYSIEKDAWEHRFTGAALFSVGRDYHVDKQTAAVMAVPMKTVEAFLRKLAQARPTEGEYEPFISHTDDYPEIVIRVGYGGGKTIMFFTRSQGTKHVPWLVSYDGKSYVVKSAHPAQALKLLEPYLVRNILEDMVEQALSRGRDAEKA